jgi:DNA-binding transcriptional ArsR family regulator
VTSANIIVPGGQQINKRDKEGSFSMAQVDVVVFGTAASSSGCACCATACGDSDRSMERAQHFEDVMKMASDIFDLRTRITKALAHPLRLKIIDQLDIDQERCVCELVDVLCFDQPVVSKHLAVLKNAGLVTSRQEGTSVYYKLRTPCVKKFLDCIDRVMKENLQATREEMAGVSHCISEGE